MTGKRVIGLIGENQAAEGHLHCLLVCGCSTLPPAFTSKWMSQRGSESLVLRTRLSQVLQFLPLAPRTCTLSGGHVGSSRLTCSMHSYCQLCNLGEAVLSFEPTTSCMHFFSCSLSGTRSSIAEAREEPEHYQGVLQMMIHTQALASMISSDLVKRHSHGTHARLRVDSFDNMRKCLNQC